MTTKLTQTQHALLGTGIEREDRCVVIGSSGQAAAAKRLAAKMIDAGWLKEIKAKPNAPVWRTDKVTGATYSLKLTATGARVYVASKDEFAEPQTSSPMDGDVNGSDHNPASESPKVPRKADERRTFREGSKLAGVMNLLQREGGVTVDELSAAMNWLPHSTRAALTGLRKRGIALSRRKGTDQRASVYFIEPSDGGSPETR
jgi:hypothetical protein